MNEIEAQGPFSHMAVLVISSSILGGGIGTRYLVKNAWGKELRLKTIVAKFNTTITLKNFNLSRILIFHEGLKLKKYIKKIRFKIHRVKPCKLRVVINKNNIKSKAHWWFHWSQFPYVTVNKAQNGGGPGTISGKMKLVTLSKLTSRANRRIRQKRNKR